MKRIFLYSITILAILVVLEGILAGVSDLLGFYGLVLQVFAFSPMQTMAGFLLIAAIIGVAGSLLSLALSRWLALKTAGARLIDEPGSSRELWLLKTLARLARQSGLECPQVAVFESSLSNAFTVGATRKRAIVLISTGLMENLSQDQIEGVLGHEIAHVANGDMVTLALLQGVLNTFVFFAARLMGVLVDRPLFRSKSGYGPGYYLIVVLAEIIFGVLATLIVYGFARRREYRADAASAHLAGRSKMVGALQALQEADGSKRFPGPFRAFCINGGSGSKQVRMFSTHPPVAVRIEALRNNE